MSRSIEPTMNMSGLNFRLGKSSEAARITRQFDERPFQGSTGPAIRLQDAAQSMPAPLPGSGPLNIVLRVILRVFEEGRAVLQGSRAPGLVPASIEDELSRFAEGFRSGKVRCEISVTGHRRTLRPEVQEQIKLIWREALANAFRHSAATCIEAEIEYSARRIRLVIRDNGCGIDPEAARTSMDAHCGLLGMRERAESVGAKLTIWSKPGAGTEVEISVPGPALTNVCA